MALQNRIQTCDLHSSVVAPLKPISPKDEWFGRGTTCTRVHNSINISTGFTILPDDRDFTVLPDDRGFTILPDDRDFAVLLDDRGFTILPDDRDFTVVQDDRGFAILPDDRDFTVLADDRDFTVLLDDREVLPTDFGPIPGEDKDSGVARTFPVGTVLE